MNNYFDNNGRYNTNNNRPLIPRQQNYFLERKLLSIHSEDRDINKWPNTNHFAVSLPESIKNIDSMRLVECQLPINYYTFSNFNQNTKLSFTIEPKDPSDNFYTILNDNSMNDYTITIEEGFYTLTELEIELQYKMNDVVNRYIIDNSGGLPLNNDSGNYLFMNVFYDNVAQKYWIGNSRDSFILKFNKQEMYDISFCITKENFNKYAHWGLPHNLGFEKQEYKANVQNETLKITHVVEGFNNFITSISGNPVYYIKAPYIHDNQYFNTIYMEVDKYNTYDELQPYSERTTNLFNNDFNCKVNSAFAKLPLTNTPHGVQFESINGFLTNIITFNPPKERISFLEFKFRYHDGRLVDFNKNNFNFTIEFNTLRDEIPRNYNVRIPDLYNL